MHVSHVVLTATLLLASAIPSIASIPASKVLYNSSVVRVPPAHRTIRTVSLSTIAWDADLSPPPLPPPPRSVMGAQQAGGATYFTVCAPFSSDDPPTAPIQALRKTSGERQRWTGDSRRRAT